ncbi:CPBP family intramembrane glutamic endopeptidase [Subtercola boreus]|nr:type II CAAX endopeptidase family protein [Subtercola boreus]
MRVSIFLVIAYGLAWIFALPLWLQDGLQNPLFGLIAGAIMFTPLISAVLISTLVEGRSIGSLLVFSGLRFSRPFKTTLLWSLGALVGTEILVFSGVAIVVSLGITRVDLVEFSGFAELLHEESPTKDLPAATLAIAQLAAIPVGAVFNCLLTVGEEVGWRGWLLPTLRPVGAIPALAVSSVVWGLWHAPLILLGYNFDQPNALGLALMVGGCTFFGFLLGWLRLKSNSLWPPMIAHGAFNAAAGTLALIAAAGETPDLVTAGPLGIVAWIPMAVTLVFLALIRQFRFTEHAGIDSHSFQKSGV